MVKKLSGREQHIGIQRVEYDNMNKMRPILHIELDELIEYRDELDNVIKKYERLNSDWDTKATKLEEAGYNLEDVDSIMSILFEETEENDDK